MEEGNVTQKKTKLDSTSQIEQNLLLPDEIVREILSFVSFPYNLVVRLVCKKWKDWIENQIPVDINLLRYSTSISNSSLEKVLKIFHKYNHLELFSVNDPIQTSILTYLQNEVTNISSFKFWGSGTNDFTINFLLTKATSLTSLNLPWVKTFPDIEQLTKLTKLTELCWKGYRMPSISFETVAKMTWLKSLDMNLSSPVTSSLKSLTNLTHLRITNYTESIDLKNILGSHFSQLEECDISMPNSEPSNYSLLKVLPNLNSVVLYKAKFDSSSFAIFAQEVVPKLKSLNLMRCENIGDMKIVPSLNKMKELRVTGSGLDSTSVSHILSILNPSICTTLFFKEIIDINDNTLIHLNRLTSLQNLHLHESGVTGKAISHIPSDSLLDFQFEKSKSFTSEDIVQCSKFSKLRRLVLFSINLTSSKEFSSLCNLENLEELRVHSVQIDNIEGISELTQLRSLYLGIKELSNEGFKSITRLTNLTHLNIGNCTSLFGENENLSFLDKIHLESLSLPIQITDKQIFEIIDQRKVKKLDLKATKTKALEPYINMRKRSQNCVDITFSVVSLVI